MQFKKVGNTYFIRIFKDEKVTESLLSFCKENSIKLAKFSGIGAVKKIEIGCYHLKTKAYLWKTFEKDHEVTSFLGNISVFEEELAIHAHINISDESLQVFGGHLKEAKVAVTLEIIMDVFVRDLKRELDEEIGLNLWQFND